MKRGLIVSCLGIAAIALAVPAMLVWAEPACADSWMLPETTTYLSPGKGCRLTVVPRDLESQLAYFEGKTNNTRNAGQHIGGTPNATATLERRLPNGQWQRVWSRSLVNDVAPVDALVSDRMDYIVTFDNWHSVGYGDDAIAIYDVANGGVRTFSVEKLLGSDYFAALPHSVSSVAWRGDRRIEGGKLIIDIVVPNESRSTAAERHVALAIDLASGKISERSPRAWRDARASAERVNATARASEQALRTAHIAPLLAPKADDEARWHAYLREAFFRLDADWVESYPATDVLRPRSAANYSDSVRWVTEGLSEGGDVRMFAGANEADLIEVLKRGVAPLPRGALGDTRIYVAASEANRSRLTAIFAPSRAALILLDPSRPIPQRPERLPRADGSIPSRHDFQKSDAMP